MKSSHNSLEWWEKLLLFPSVLFWLQRCVRTMYFSKQEFKSIACRIFPIFSLMTTGRNLSKCGIWEVGYFLPETWVSSGFTPKVTMIQNISDHHLWCVTTIGTSFWRSITRNLMRLTIVNPSKTVYQWIGGSKNLGVVCTTTYHKKPGISQLSTSWQMY